MIKLRYLILLLIFSLFVVFGVSYARREQMKEFSNDDIVVSYDKSWKIKTRENGVSFEHKKTRSILNIQVKILDDNYIDTMLSDIVGDIINSIEVQNIVYTLISKDEDTSGKYEMFSYLYEKDMEQVLVNIYKKDKTLVIVYYEAESEYYDIVLDSVDTILDSLEIKTGEEILKS